jgi:PIN domain
LSRLILFADTNVFLQCRALHEVPWGDAVQADEIELVIGAPVQDEIDRLKGDGNSRRARRARETNSLFRSSLASPGESLTLRESAPKVTLRFAPALPPQRESAETLDLTRSDDQLLDEVMHFRRTEPSVQILSGDTGMILRARRLGVPLIPVPESWLLPPEKDDRDRQIGALRAEVAGLRSAEALLSLSLNDERSQPVETIAGSLPLYRDLTAEEVNGLIRAVERSHPEVKAFGSNAPAAKASEGLGALGPLLEGLASFRAPNTDQIARYHDDYEEWIGRARKLFEQLGPSLNIRHRIYKLRVALANTSSRPADEVLLDIMSGPTV